jgi:hypothetical protein
MTTTPPPPPLLLLLLLPGKGLKWNLNKYILLSYLAQN